MVIVIFSISIYFLSKKHYHHNTYTRFVRQIETYQSLNFQLPTRVYFLMYTNSCEEQRYLTSIRSEKGSFEILIKEKAVSLKIKVFLFRIKESIRYKWVIKKDTLVII